MEGDYIGEIDEDDKPFGLGVWTRSDEDVFIGTWKKGLRHALGIYWDNKGDIYIMEYDQGKLNGKATYYYKQEGNIMNAEFLDDEPKASENITKSENQKPYFSRDALMKEFMKKK